jgi:FdhD protein
MELTRRPGPSVRVRVEEHTAGPGGDRVVRREDRLATEEPLEVRLAWPGGPATRVGVTMRTPGQDFELAVGMLLSEGLLSPAALSTVAYCTDVQLTREQEFNVVTVSLSQRPPREVASRATTVTAASSACGVCGTESIDDVLRLAGVQRAAAPARVSSAVLRSLPARLRERQRIFDSTGGLHAAALTDESGELLVLREDIGRHNAVDKVYGARVLAGEPTATPVLLVSGRIGFEIVQKAVAGGAGLLAAIGAPSSLAARLADQAGLGLVGFLSAERFVVYAGADRIGV